MTIGNIISYLRKQNEMTQEMLASKLGVSNQAVSKWEADQCCPDISLLPKLADTFNVSIDRLFGRTGHTNKYICPTLPWDNDRTLRVVAFIGHELQEFQPINDAEDIKVVYEGDALDINSCISVHCANVNGDITAGGYVECDAVRGDVNAGLHILCGNIDGDVTAKAHVECGAVRGDVNAGLHILCGNIDGDATAGAHIQCGDIGGDATAEAHIQCGNIRGDANSKSHINCKQIEGDANSDGGIYYIAEHNAL